MNVNREIRMRVLNRYALVPTLLALAMMVWAEEVPPAPASTEEKEEPLGKRLLEREYNRMPAMALQAMAQRLAGTLGDDAVERFAIDLQAGAWSAVGKTLASLPSDMASEVYDHVLQQMVENEGALLPGEVIDLAEIAPSELTDKRLAMLGRILQTSIGLVSATGSLVARLEAGTPLFGGADPAKRGRAAALLLAADRVIEAGGFLPPLDAALAAGDDGLLDLHARFLVAVGRERKEPANLNKAWQLSTAILARPAVDPALAEVRQRAVARCLSLLDDVPREQGDTWLAQVFTQRPDLTQMALAEVAAAASQALGNKEEEQRRVAQARQYRVVTTLLRAVGRDSDRWTTSLDLLSLGWLNEATLAMTGDEDDEGGASGVEAYIREQMRQYNPAPNQVQAYRQYFHKQYFQNRGGGRNRNRNEAQPLAVSVLLATAPTPEWLALLDSSLAQRLRSLVGEFVCRGGDRERALALIHELATDEPERASRLARSLVRAFTRSLNTTDDDTDERRSTGNGIPLTRARQTRNLKQLAELLGRINELPVKAVPAADLVAAFVACHSPAEVFRAEDISSVLGNPRTLPAGVLVALVSAMRERLADTWRKPGVQQQASTQRTDAEVVAEVERGYRVAKELCSQSQMLHPLAWQLIQVQASLDFDHGEFMYGQQAPLATYTALRDAAFAGYAVAAQAYALTLAGADEQQHSVEVYSRWFAAALGASDLSYLSRQQEADDDQVAAVRDALGELPEIQAERHRELFAKQVVANLGELNPELKPRYLRHALRIIGDRPLAAEIKAIVADYDELLGEVELALTVDGSTTVGSSAPFGVHLSLRHTTALGRESGGFEKYLQNQVQSSGGAQVNYRNDLEKHLREMLSEQFSIASITFHAAGVTSHGYGREGWRDMPLAYLVLKAKDPSVDRLPSVRIDLDFVDGHGAVILPVASGVALIDARSAAQSRTAQVASVDFTLDDRELNAGRLSLEIRASGTGLIGDLPGLLDPAVPGFTVAGIEDRGPTVTAMEVDGANVRPRCERVWLVQYAPQEAVIPATFAFPDVTAVDVTIKRQRYVDADLLDAAAIESLSPRQSWWVQLRPWLAGGGVLGLVAVGWWLLRRVQRRTGPAAPRFAMPAEIHPVAVLGLLRAMHAETSLPAAQGARLADVIADLERRCFARDGHAPNADELQRVAHEWLATVGTSTVARAAHS